MSTLQTRWDTDRVLALGSVQFLSTAKVTIFDCTNRFKQQQSTAGAPTAPSALTVAPMAPSVCPHAPGRQPDGPTTNQTTRRQSQPTEQQRSIVAIVAIVVRRSSFVVRRSSFVVRRFRRRAFIFFLHPTYGIYRLNTGQYIPCVEDSSPCIPILEHNRSHISLKRNVLCVYPTLGR